MGASDTYLAMSSRTLYKGLSELLDESKYDQIPVGKQRRVGGGRKKNFAKTLNYVPT